MNKNEKRVFWKKHIQACETTGSKVAHYCKEHQLSESQYYFYRNELKQVDIVSFQEVKPLEVSIVEFTLNGIPITVRKEQLHSFLEAICD